MKIKLTLMKQALLKLSLLITSLSFILIACKAKRNVSVMDGSVNNKNEEVMELPTTEEKVSTIDTSESLTYDENINIEMIENLKSTQSAPTVNTEISTNEKQNQIVNSTKKPQQYLYTLKLSVENATELDTNRVQLKGSNTYSLNVDVLARIKGANDKEERVESKHKNRVSQSKIVDGEFKNIKVLISSSDKSVRFENGSNSIEISKTLSTLDIEDRSLVQEIIIFNIDEKYIDSKKNTIIKAEVFLENSNESIQSQKIELEIVPLSFDDKLKGLSAKVQTESFDKLYVLYTGILGIIVTAILAFVRRKLKVKDEHKEETNEE